MSNYIISDHTFLVDRIVFTRRLKGLTEERLKLYLFMCRVVSVDPNNRYFMSYQQANKELNISEHKYRSALKWLEQNFFIRKTGNVGRANAYQVLFLPVYDGATYHSRAQIKRDRNTFKQGGYGYVEMPIELLEGSILSNHSVWKDLRIMTLGLLYLYFWIDVYGGIDPNVLYVDAQGDIKVDESLYTDLKTTENRLINNIQFFEKQGLLKKVQCIYRKNPNAAEEEYQYIGDVGKVLALPTDQILTLYRFTIIPSLKLQNAQNRTKSGVQL
jgi:hypothetical protein